MTKLSIECYWIDSLHHSLHWSNQMAIGWTDYEQFLHFNRAFVVVVVLGCEKRLIVRHIGSNGAYAINGNYRLRSDVFEGSRHTWLLHRCYRITVGQSDSVESAFSHTIGLFSKTKMGNWYQWLSLETITKTYLDFDVDGRLGPTRNFLFLLAFSFPLFPCLETIANYLQSISKLKVNKVIYHRFRHRKNLQMGECRRNYSSKNII